MSNYLEESNNILNRLNSLYNFKNMMSIENIIINGNSTILVFKKNCCDLTLKNHTMYCKNKIINYSIFIDNILDKNSIDNAINSFLNTINF